jgi:hypothetical protein
MTSRDLDEIRQHDRHADRRDQRREAEGAAQRPVGDAFDRPVPQGRQHHADDQHAEKGERHRRDAEPGRDDEEDDQRDEGGDHEQVAMGEIDHADDAEDHRVADGDETVDGAERNAVDQLLDEIFHTCPDPHHPPANRRALSFRRSGGPAHL